MPDIAMDPTTVKSTGRKLVTAGESTLTLPGAGGAAHCGAPVVATTIAEFERELASYTSLVGEAIAGIGHCTMSTAADMESTEAEIQHLTALLHTELSSISASTAAPAVTPTATNAKKLATTHVNPGHLESIMGQ
jgi:hypothetical protein